MSFRRLMGIALFLAAFLSPAELLADPSLDRPPLFEKDVRPILKAHCFHCHGEEEVKKGGLDVRLARFLAKGGDSGPALVAGDSKASILVEVLESGEMPKEKPKLSEKEISTIRRWIESGAKTARPEPETLGPGHLFTEEERAWWSLQPVSKPEVPGGHDGETRNEIDAFVLARLREVGLDFQREADPRVLLRRASFSLVGLPPTPQETEEFLSAFAENPETASSGLIERLLASPAHGERWARHWLDVAGYADSEGVTEKDIERKDAWRYRDYVIASLNEDKPYDQFLREQLAGDEIALRLGLNADSPTSEERERYAELLVATGLLRMAPDGTAQVNSLENRNAAITSTIQIVSTAFYGLTIGCAECHDHRYDPISQADFYRLRAVFQPGFTPDSWRVPAARRVSLQTSSDKARAAEIEAQAREADARRTAKQKEFIEIILRKELEKCEAELRDPLRKAYETEAKERTPEQVALLKKHPRVQNLSAGSLYLYDTTYGTKHAKILEEMSAESAAIRAKKPKEEFVRAFLESPQKEDAIPATHVFQRGDPEALGKEVTPSDLAVLESWREVAIPVDDSSLPTTGRRLALAERLTDGEHPLVARVIVNRVWMHHFGKGLVGTVGDFGHLGETPSHPELLDWLAGEFVENGWSLKWLHRTILGSRTWRQASERDAERDRIDPDNRLLSRQNRRRIEAETLRDSLLSVSGTLRDKIGGEPVPVMFTEEGMVVIGVDTTDTAGRQTGKYVSLEGEEFRKSIYIQARRSRPLEIFAAFDAPAMTGANCEIRPITTVSPQSLLLMNHLGMREFAQHFAERLEQETESTAEAVDLAWRLCFARPPTDAERADSEEFLTLQTAYYLVNPAGYESLTGPPREGEPSARFLGLAAFAHALLSANEFLYID